MNKINTLFQVQNSEKSNDISHDKFASMDIYVVNKEAMIKLLTEYHPLANDFRREVVPGAISLGMNVRVMYYHIQPTFCSNLRSLRFSQNF